METQNHTSSKRNYTLLFFLHFRGTNHIAGSRLSIGKAGGYSKEQDKKKKSQGKTMKGKTKRCSCCLRNQFES